MAIMGNMLKSGQALLRRVQNNQTFTFNGTALDCVRSTEQRDLVIAVGGSEVVVVLSLFIEKTEFPTGLTVDSTLISVDSTLITADMTQANKTRVGNKGAYRGREYRVARITLIEDDIYRLDLKDPHAR